MQKVEVLEKEKQVPRGDKVIQYKKKKEKMNENQVKVRKTVIIYENSVFKDWTKC